MARLFNGSSDYIEGAAPVTGSPCSAWCWYNWTSDSNSQDRFLVLSDASSAAERMSLAVEGTGDDEQRYNPNDGTTNLVVDYPATGVDYVAPGIWLGAGFTEAGTARKNYIETGAFVSEGTTLTFTGNIDIITVGAWNNSGGRTDFWLGDVAEVAVWDVVLTDAEMAILGLGYSPLFVRPAALVFYAPLVRDAIDIVGGTALTVNGTTVSNHPRIIYPSPQQMAFIAPAVAAGGLINLIGSGGLIGEGSILVGPGGIIS